MKQTIGKLSPIITLVMCTAMLLGSRRADLPQDRTSQWPDLTPMIVGPSDVVLLASTTVDQAHGDVNVEDIVQATPGHTLWMEVTAYCPCKKCCGSHAKGITASGKTVAYNDGQFVAADLGLLPFGTKLQIPGYAEGKSVEVIDKGGAIKGRKLDLFFQTHDEALQWGRKRIPVFVMD